MLPNQEEKYQAAAIPSAIAITQSQAERLGKYNTWLQNSDYALGEEEVRVVAPTPLAVAATNFLRVAAGDAADAGAETAGCIF